MQSVHTSEIMPKLNWPALGAGEPCGLDMECFLAFTLGFQIAWSIPRLMSFRLTAENLPKTYTLEMQISSGGCSHIFCHCMVEPGSWFACPMSMHN